MCQLYNFAFFDEASKREIRRAIIKGVSIPGHQIPFASREMPIGRGWGTGGLQITLALIGQGDVLKVIDQGADDSVNAVNIKKLVVETTDVEVTEKTQHATPCPIPPSHPRTAAFGRSDTCSAGSDARAPAKFRAKRGKNARASCRGRLHRGVAGAV